MCLHTRDANNTSTTKYFAVYLHIDAHRETRANYHGEIGAAKWYTTKEIIYDTDRQLIADSTMSSGVDLLLAAGI